MSYTKIQVKEKLTAIGDVSDDVKKTLVCSLIGHSNILKGCFGYMHCARCNEQVGDALAGSYQNDDAVIIGHDCSICRTNAKRLTWKDTFMAKRHGISKEAET